MYYKFWYKKSDRRPIGITQADRKQTLTRRMMEFSIMGGERYKAIIIMADSREEAIVKSKSVEIKWQ